MKKLISLLLALLIAALSTAALAAPGDAVIARRTDESFTDYIRATAVDGDVLRFDYYSVHASYRIDYCPICGRKLLASSLKEANKYEYQ